MSICETDVAVIGAGPVGLFAVFALGQVGLSAVVIDALHEAGGQCATLYPEKPIYDIPSRASITGAALIEDLLAQANSYAPDYRLGHSVRSLLGDNGRFDLGLSDGSQVRAGAVLIAAGAGAFGPNRPPLDGLAAYEGHSVFYSVRTASRFRNQHVVIAGGGDSAADWAVQLAGIAASVTVIHRRSTFRAAPAPMASIHLLAEEGRIAVVAPGVLHGIEGDRSVLHAVLVDQGRGEIRRLPADVLLCFFGLAKDVSAMASWQIGAGRDGIPVDPRSCETCRPGIYAIGDIAHYPGKLKLMLTGFAEAAAAAHAARHRLRPDQAFHFEYSTARGQPTKAAAAGHADPLLANFAAT